jgi:hypothetical protein
MPEEKVRENLARRQLDRMGYKLMKSRARDSRGLTFGGYQIIDVEGGGVVAGYGNASRGYAYDLKDVEAWIADAPTTKDNCARGGKAGLV